MSKIGGGGCLFVFVLFVCLFPCLFFVGVFFGSFVLTIKRVFDILSAIDVLKFTFAWRSEMEGLSLEAAGQQITFQIYTFYFWIWLLEVICIWQLYNLTISFFFFIVLQSSSSQENQYSLILTKTSGPLLKGRGRYGLFGVLVLVFILSLCWNSIIFNWI